MAFILNTECIPKITLLEFYLILTQENFPFAVVKTDTTKKKDQIETHSTPGSPSSNVLLYLHATVLFIFVRRILVKYFLFTISG